MGQTESWGLALRLARRELRGGLRGFWVFMLCLVLGVAAISSVGLVRKAIEGGLEGQGRILLGGDAKLEATYRRATEAERAFMADIASDVAEVVDFRSMAVVGEERALTQVKAVDGRWPLLGTAEFAPELSVEAVFAPQGGLPGAAMDRALSDRLGLQVGDRFKMGLQEFHLSAILLREPDSSTAGFGLGPRTLVRSADLEASGLLAAGTLYETEYRLVLKAGQDLDQAKARAEAEFRDTGLRWRDHRRAAPGIERFVERMSTFLVLVGLAGLAVGGVGISSAVRAYLERKTGTIATLRSLGASQRLIFRIYLLQVMILALIAIAQGLILGMGLPLMLSPLIADLLPVPVVFAPYPAPMMEAAFYGLTVALLFSIWPLARGAEQRAATLFRNSAGGTSPQGWPRPFWVAVTMGLVVLLVGGAMVFSGVPSMALSAAVGIALALGLLLLAALGLRRLARRASRHCALRGRPALRLAISAIGAPRSEAVPVVLALGLGLTVLAAIGQVESNLRQAIDRDLPERAPSYFVLDIQNDQIGDFLSGLQADEAVSRIDTAPMLRGVLTRINGRPAHEVAPNHWVVRGDRGITYADRLPSGTTITQGTWWPEGYTGPPQISMAETEAREIGIQLGDKLTVNVLGRDIEGQVTSLRAVDFTTGGIGFVLLFNASAVAGAPHSHIATVYAEEAAEGRLLRDMARSYPNITAIRIRDIVAQAGEALSAIAAGTAGAAGATLLTGLVVLIGAVATGGRARMYEAAILKTLGATRGRILASFALRSALMGAAAGVIAVVAGGLAAWAVMRLGMEMPYRFDLGSALAIVLGGLGVVLVAGVIFAWQPLATRPARTLRPKD